MRILYGCGNCSQKKYNELFAGKDILIAQQAQKYHYLLLTGLAQNGVDVTCISGLPVNRKLMQNCYIEGGNETENGVQYHYFGAPNYPILRRAVLVVKSFFKSLVFSNKDLVMVCDILNVSIATGMLIAAKLKRIKIIGIVTDVPGCLSYSDGKKKTEKFNAYIMKKFDGYVLLTEQMNSLINTNNRPYVVIEGQVDTDMVLRENKPDNKQMPKILMYAGSLMRIYGIENLCKAFILTNVEGWELHIYGDGDFKDSVVQMCKEYTSIKYMGIKLNDEIVEAEIQASLLVNPRPTKDEYTHYSFPSKNMEYMVSGTPMLTTKLPGMPPEYYKFIYSFDGDDVDSMSITLKEVMSKSSQELNDKGIQAKEFVLNNKNNIIAAKKIIQLVGI